MKIADQLREGAIIKMLAMQDADIAYNEALYYYNKVQKFNPNNAELNYKIGSSLLSTNQKEFSFSYLKKVKELSEDLPNDFLFY